MIDVKHSMKLERAGRSFEYAARDMGAEHLLDQVTHDDVEAIVFLEQRQRYCAACSVLRRLLEAESKP